MKREEGGSDKAALDKKQNQAEKNPPRLAVISELLRGHNICSSETSLEFDVVHFITSAFISFAYPRRRSKQ